jgi:hypothetical protein
MASPADRYGRRPPRRSTEPEILEAFPQTHLEVDPWVRPAYFQEVDGELQPASVPNLVPEPAPKNHEPKPVLKSATTPPPPSPPAPPPVSVVVDLAGLADALCACIKEQTEILIEELPRRTAKLIEQRLVTSRGIVVTPPPTCSQPVGGTDVDDQVVKHTIPAANPGTRTTVLKRTASRSTVLKGLNWSFAIDKATAKLVDPADQVAIHVVIDGKPVGNSPQAKNAPTSGTRTNSAYQNQRVPPAPGGITSLGAAQIYVREGQTVELIAERVTPPSGQDAIQFHMSARWKGWDWTPTINAPGATGAGGF